MTDWTLPSKTQQSCCKPSGPTNAKIVAVGEAPGETEEKDGVPFVGKSGQELTRMMADAGLLRSQIRLTNVFQSRPPGNAIEDFCCRKAYLPSDYPSNLPPMTHKGGFLKAEHLWNLVRLRREIEEVQPNLILALGATALWAVCRLNGINAYRGAVMNSTILPGTKVIATFHPASVLRKWEQRVPVLADLMKAKVESEFPEIRRIDREIWLDPTIEDLHEFAYKYMDESPLLSFDIETKPSQHHIKCISFSPTPYQSIIVPFVDEKKKGYHYWDDEFTESLAWAWVKRNLESLRTQKCGQNGLYDIQYLYREAGIKVMNYTMDPMLHHHALFPEMPKDLGFLGSIYTNESAWKKLRAKGPVDKRED